MKKVIQVGTALWRNMHGNALLEVTDLSPSDPTHPNAPTIGFYKQRVGGLDVPLTHPCGKQFHLDLSAWSHLSDETRLHLLWKFVPERAQSQDSENEIGTGI
jgi:hypothetical protein